MARKQLRRSATNKQIAGVCGGIGEYLGVDPSMVRLVAVVLAFLTSAPVVFAYILGAVALPVEDGDTQPAVAVDWQPDGLRVRWSGPTVPHAVPWLQLLGGLAGLGGIVAVLGGAAFVTAPFVGVDPELALSAMAAFSGLFWPLAVLAGIVGMLPRPYTLTVTHDALWVERPTRKAHRIDLAEVEGLYAGSDGFAVHLRDGELLRVAPPPDDIAIDVLREQIEGARRRALGHQVDLAEAEAERKQLQALLAARQRE